jgi:hypothetical protein
MKSKPLSNLIGLTCALCAVVALGLIADAPAYAQPAAPAASPPAGDIQPVISINALMVKFVDQAADVIWSAAVDPPKRTCEWDQVEFRATQLATTGTLLRVGGTGPLDMQWRNSPNWAPYADNMTRIALQAARAATNRNIVALKKAGNALVLNCEACHRQFKPAIPTQNILTHLSHAVPLAEDLPPNCRLQDKRR